MQGSSLGIQNTRVQINTALHAEGELS